MAFHFLAKRTFEFVGAFDKLFDAAELCDELGGGFFAHTRTSGNVVGSVAHESE